MIDFIWQYSRGMHCLYHLIMVLTFECRMFLGFSNLRYFGLNLLLKNCLPLTGAHHEPVRNAV